MNISDKIKYIGVDDTTIDLFESQYAVPDGVSYNSYVILDDKTAIMDTVDKRGMKDWENNLLNAQAEKAELQTSSEQQKQSIEIYEQQLAVYREALADWQLPEE